jgi:RHS repeat-associated protein
MRLVLQRVIAYYEYGLFGNRLSEATQAEINVYIYDDANRLASANGNLLSDGVNSYTYDGANRLTGVTDGVSAVSYAYNGLGDRLQTSAAGQTTRYTLDRVSGLTQVLEDGGYTYLYGNGRVAQYGVNGGEYFLGDALGSVRQLADASGAVRLTRSYQPYGELLASNGDGESVYGFTGEATDALTGMVYLRARWYAPQFGRFTSQDPWNGDYYQPMSYNAWLYVYNNPINYTDPSGMEPACDRFQQADLTQWLIDELNTNRESWIANLIRIAVQKAHFADPENPFSGEPGASALAYLTFYDVVKTNGLWDFKWEIRDKIGKNIRIAGSWYKQDLPANVNFGYIGVAVGFSEQTLHCGADFATNRQWCSGADPIRDYEAIEVGFDIWRFTRGGPVNEDVLNLALAMHPQIPQGSEKEPNPKSLSLDWPYPVGTFDDGSSGWWIKNRNW